MVFWTAMTQPTILPKMDITGDEKKDDDPDENRWRLW